MRMITLNAIDIPPVGRKDMFDRLRTQVQDVVCLQETNDQSAQIAAALCRPAGAAPR